MKIKIKQPAALYEKGNASHNEDFIFPIHNQANPEEKLFVVCDGDGGPNRGDIASKLVALSLAKYFASSPPKQKLDQAYLDEALRAAEDALTAYQESHQDTQGMRTTLAMLHLGEEQATLAWVGDTQIYHFSHKERKLLNPTRERGNPSARISGNGDPQSLLVHPIPLADLHKGDSFLLATTGINQHLQIDTLASMMQVGAEHNPDQVIAEINQLTQADHTGNYSCYLVQIDAIETGVAQASTDNGATAAAQQQADDTPAPDQGNSGLGQFQKYLIGFLVIAVLSVIAMGIFNALNDPYKDLMSKGKDLLAEEQYTEAMSRFTKAAALADSLNNVPNYDAAMALRDSAQRLMAQQRLAEAGMQSIEQKIEAGKEFYEKKNFIAAIEAWQEARNLMAQNASAEDSLLPRMEFLNAYMKAAEAAYEAESYEKAQQYYAQAQALMANLEADGAAISPERSEQVNQRMANINVQLGIEEPTNLATSETAAEGAEEEGGVRTRSLPSPETTAPARREAAPGENTSSKETSTRSVTTDPNATRRLAEATPSSFDEPKLTDEQAAEMNKNLSTGKRFYTEAKQKDSQYLYRNSVQKLEAAGSRLDGPGAYLLAFMYHSGLGVEANEAKALRYAQISARERWPAGQYYYGYLLLQRQNPRDTTTAVQSLELAARQNYLDAIELLEEIR